MGFSPGVRVANPDLDAPCAAGLRSDAEGAGFTEALAAFEGAGFAGSGAGLGADGASCCASARMFPDPST